MLKEQNLQPIYYPSINKRNLDEFTNKFFKKLEPGQFLMTVIRGTGTTVGLADTATVTVEYAAVEIDSNA